MEKVWRELRKIEAEAEQIRAEAQTKAKEITNIAKQEAEELLANSKTYAHLEGEQFQERTVEVANKNRERQLKTNEEALKKLERIAEKRLPRAQETIVHTVLGKTKP